MNGMNGYLLLVVCLSTLQKQVQEVPGLKCCSMSKTFTIAVAFLLVNVFTLARGGGGVTLTTADRDDYAATSTSVDPADSTQCDRVFVLTPTGSGPFTVTITSGDTNNAFSDDEDRGDKVIICDTTILTSNALASYTLVVRVTDGSDDSFIDVTLTVTVAIPTLGLSCSSNSDCTTASGEVCEASVCKLGHGEDCFSNTGSCVSHATCSSTCSCASGYLDNSGICKAGLDTACSADADCDTATNVGAVCDTNVSPNVCKLGDSASCSSNTDKCVTNGACDSTCSCDTGFTAQSSLCTASAGSGSTTLNCYHCSNGTGCDKDDVTGSTQSSTFESDNCVYCFIAWSDNDAARGCLTSTMATSRGISRTGCTDGWTEGVNGTGCACDSALCNATPTTAGYQNTANTLNDFSAHLRFMSVAICLVFISR